MITRDQALTLIKEHVTNANIVSHMMALEAVMGKLYDNLPNHNATKEEWMLAGLLHDGDYCDAVPHNLQGIQIIDWAKAAGFEVSDAIAHATAAHNWHNTGVAPENLMDWSIFTADSLTGLIVASALVLPTKKLADVKLSSVLKRFKEKSFAAGTRRDEVAMCEEKLGLKLEDFISLSLTAMQEIAPEIEL